MRSYDPAKIEGKWQGEWEREGIYRASEEGSKEKAYVLDMFPYPSGEGLHVGHPKGYIATDVYSRWSRMNGKNVLHPMGWDAFGLPAENYAIKNQIHPRAAVEKNIARFKEQLKKIGLDYDWSREVNTTDPEYYKWTQWIFLKLLEKGLAYESNEPINWCPTCQTGLANEDLEDNACERCGTIVEKKPLRQWVLKITDYADRMLEDLALLPEWQEHIKESQRNWIGRSEGAIISFGLQAPHYKAAVEVFTTRPDTLFGATYLVLAPEKAAEVLASGLEIENAREVHAYIEKAGAQTEIERTAEGREKTGVELKGISALNPATGESIPVFVADYVLGHYGTGAIMAVPAHDERDYQFARAHDLPIRQVVRPVFGTEHKRDDAVQRETVSAFVRMDDGKVLALKWKEYDWLTGVIGGIEKGETPEQAAEREVKEETGYSAKAVYVSPIAIESHYFAEHKKEWRSRLDHPVLLTLEDDQKGPLSEEERAKHDTCWMTPEEIRAHGMFKNNLLALELALGTQGAYASPEYGEEQVLTNSGSFDTLPVAEAKKAITETYGRPKVTYRLRDWVFSRQRYWGEPIPIIHCKTCGAVPVPYEDLPVRLPDVEKYEPTGTGESPLSNIPEWVNTTCPKCGGEARRETNTMPQWAGSSWYYLRYMDPQNDTALVDSAKEKYWAPVNLYVGGAEHATRHLIYARFWHKFLFDIGVVSTPEPFTRLVSVGLIMAEDGKKMSKRYGNVINPDDIIATYGADTLRVYEMFMGPFTDAISWNTNSMIGARRFLERVWKLSGRVSKEGSESVERLLHKTIRKVGDDISAFKFNTAVSALMIFVNSAEKDAFGKGQFMRFLQVLAPFAPHMTEELWHAGGGEGSVHVSPWPLYDPAQAKDDTVTIAVQINGKTRGSFEIAADAPKEEQEQAAHSAVAERLAGKSIKRAIVVPGRLVNFVIEE